MYSLKSRYWNYSQKPKCYPKKICLVDKLNDSLLELAKKLGLPVLDSYSNNNQMGELEKETIYVINEFEDNPIIKLFQASNDIWVIGPTFTEEFTTNMNLVLRTHPTFCTSMYGLVFHINCPGNRPLMERMVQLIKWMGGHFVSSPNRHVTHMITTSSRAKGYIYCWTFNVPILTPEWVEHCWQQRSIVGFKAALHMDNFEIAPFADIYLCFVGFDSMKSKEFRNLAVRNGGHVVSYSDPACTHMIFSDDYNVNENVFSITSNIFMVNSNWFWSSLQMRHRLLEDDYQKCVLVSPLSESYICMDVIQHNLEDQDTNRIVERSPCRFSGARLSKST